MPRQLTIHEVRKFDARRLRVARGWLAAIFVMPLTLFGLPYLLLKLDIGVNNDVANFIGFLLVFPLAVAFNIAHFTTACCPWCGHYPGKYAALDLKDNCPKCGSPLCESAYKKYLKKKGPHGTPPAPKPMSVREMLMLPKKGAGK
ncbi:MAG: hypothetical protein H6839_12870 [Planctomycetes bacterium]|nr:hypothetical protein [Planctomycetota bacterium]